MSQAIIFIFLIPLAGGAAAVLLGGSRQKWLGVLTALLTVGAVAMLAAQVLRQGPQMHLVGGWTAPLGITLRCDGLSLLMLGLAAVIGLFTSFYAVFYFSGGEDEPKKAGPFWSLWLFLWGGLNCLFVSGDIFNMYLLLELILLASVGLTAISGSRAALVSGLRYLLAATAAALFYLMGVAFLYSEYSSVDLHGLAAAAPAGFLPLLALGLMMGGLALKCALFPLHFWLPPAHSTAPAPVSAVLSALVVKGGFYVIVRLWFEVFPGATGALSAHLMAVPGAVAVIWGSWMAIRQDRLKILIAYSTVAQIGYLFLLFPLAENTGREVMPVMIYQVISHGLAKAGMFLGAGALLKSAPSDLLVCTRGSFRRAPWALLAIVISGASLAGVAPGGGAKGKMIGLAGDAGDWWWSVVIGVGMALALAYTWTAVRHGFKGLQHEERERGKSERHCRVLGILALVLALLGMGVSFFSEHIEPLMEVTFSS